MHTENSCRNVSCPAGTSCQSFDAVKHMSVAYAYCSCPPGRTGTQCDSTLPTTNPPITQSPVTTTPNSITGSTTTLGSITPNPITTPFSTVSAVTTTPWQSGITTWAPVY